jgi:hypothetical protein
VKLAVFYVEIVGLNFSIELTKSVKVTLTIIFLVELAMISRCLYILLLNFLVIYNYFVF